MKFRPKYRTQYTQTILDQIYIHIVYIALANHVSSGSTNLCNLLIAVKTEAYIFFKHNSPLFRGSVGSLSFVLAQWTRQSLGNISDAKRDLVSH